MMGILIQKQYRKSCPILRFTKSISSHNGNHHQINTNHQYHTTKCIDTKTTTLPIVFNDLTGFDIIFNICNNYFKIFLDLFWYFHIFCMMRQDINHLILKGIMVKYQHFMDYVSINVFNSTNYI